MENPEIGIRIEDYENFEHLRTEVHPEWAFSPEIEWQTADADAYPKERYAHLYGFTYSDESLSRFDETDTFSINKLAPASELFYNVWYAVAMTCEPFSVLMYEGAEFPRTNALAIGQGSLCISRLDCEPGHIDVMEVNLTDGTEELHDEYDWDTETYREERFLGGINY